MNGSLSVNIYSNTLVGIIGRKMAICASMISTESPPNMKLKVNTVYFRNRQCHTHSNQSTHGPKQPVRGGRIAEDILCLSMDDI